MAKKKHRSTSTAVNSQRSVPRQTGTPSRTSSTPVDEHVLSSSADEQPQESVTPQLTPLGERSKANGTSVQVKSASSNSSVTSAAERRRERITSQRANSSARIAPSAGERRRRSMRKSWWQRNSLLLIGAILLIVVIAVGAFVIIANAPVQKAGKGTIGPTNTTILKEVTTIKQSVFANVKTGGVQNILKPPAGNPPPLTGTNGKPEVFFYGAEFCPYCGAERWPVTIALSRFGTFTQLPLTVSADANVDPSYPDIPTFTFRGSQYSSQYIDFVSLEAQDRVRQPLETPSTAQQQLLTQFNVNGFPFIDIANKYASSNAVLDPTAFENLSQQEIANMLSDPAQGMTQHIVGAANYFTAAICIATHNNPGNVCNSDPIKSISTFLTINAVASISSTSPVSFVVENCQGEPAVCRRHENSTF